MSQYQRYFAESQSADRVVYVAKINGEFAGYLTVIWQSGYPPFRQAGIPEIVDFNVLKVFQRQGIGSALMDEAEKRIARVSKLAGIGVGMDADYGAAHKLYVQRGYQPDGRGLIDNHRQVNYGEVVRMSDDLAFYFTRQVG